MIVILLTFIIVTFGLIFNNQSILTGGRNSQSVSQTKAEAKKNNSEEIKQKQQKIVGDSYSLAKDALDNSMGTLTVLSKQKTIPRTPDMYNTFKEAEDYFMKASVKFDGMSSSVGDDMGSSKDEMKKALDALATASAIHQSYFKDMADYINTGNLESQRQADQELKKNPATIMMQATNQIIKVAGDVGMDSDGMRKEVGDMLDKIKNQ